jgi:hypothetical protein
LLNRKKLPSVKFSANLIKFFYNDYFDIKENTFELGTRKLLKKIKNSILGVCFAVCTKDAIHV